MNTNPSISIIVPVYNTEEYLHECVDSILAQSFADFELLLVDDGSTDQSGVICDEYAKSDSRVRVFHKPNGGVSSARNLGLDNAQGEWIVFSDADDILPEDSLLVRIDKILHNNADLGIFGLEQFGNSGYKYSPDQAILYPDGESFRLNFQKHIHNRYIESLCNKIYRHSLFRNLRFDTLMSFGEDYMFNLIFISNCQRIMLSPEIIYKYRCYENDSLSKSFTISRLYDIDKYTTKALSFFNNDMGRAVILSQYISDINRAIIKYFANTTIPEKGKVHAIRKWYNNSLLRELPLNKWNGTWKQYCMRLLLRCSMMRFTQTSLCLWRRMKRLYNPNSAV